MRRSIPHPVPRLVPLVACLLGLLVPACHDGPTRPPDPVVATATASGDGPAAIVRSLERAYAVRSLEAFARLLAPEFLFRFQPQDVAADAPRSWERVEESLPPAGE